MFKLILGYLAFPVNCARALLCSLDQITRSFCVSLSLCSGDSPALS